MHQEYHCFCVIIISDIRNRSQLSLQIAVVYYGSQ